MRENFARQDGGHRTGHWAGQKGRQVRRYVMGVGNKVISGFRRKQ